MAKRGKVNNQKIWGLPFGKERDAAERSMDELKRESDLLRIINANTSRLLSTDTDRFGDIIQESMKEIAASVRVECISVWSCHEIDRKSYYRLEYRWGNPGGNDGTDSALVGLIGGYDSSRDERDDDELIVSNAKFTHMFDMWKNIFAFNRIINSPVSELSEYEEELIASLGIQSVLVVPIFLHSKLWGFVTFDDRQSERYFTSAEADVLRTGSMLLVNAMERRNKEMLITEHLRQQKLMYEISQSFISIAPMDNIIETALRKVGEFLCVTRILIIELEDGSDETSLRYSWTSSEEWLATQSKTEISVFVRELFPPHMYQNARVSPLYINDAMSDMGGKYAVLHENERLHSFVWAPLYIEGNLYGLISVEENDAPRVWSEADAQLIGVVSSSIAGAVARDLMDKERAELLEKAISAGKAKGDFLSHMSHEMRTPMNAIIGMTTVGRASNDVDRKEYSLAKIHEASTHLLGVINDILDMSKIENNRLELSEVQFSFEMMLKKVVNVTSYLIEEKQQKFRVKIDSRIPDTLIGDDQRLAQVVTNLVSNAVKFTPEMGAINLSANLVGEDEGVCTIEMKVADSGIGITEEQLPRLFKAFTQADSGTSRKYGGTGLGLAISKRIVEMMEGDISAESRPGEGSIFTFTVKMKRGIDTDKPMLGADVNWSNIRILVVDDERETLEYFSDLFQQFGISYSMANSGKEALEIIENEGVFDIYFVDWQMPEMDGVKLAAEIRKRDTDNCVITVISGADWSEVEDESKKASVDRFLSKPLFPSTIADLINESMGTHPVDTSASDTGIAGVFEGCRLLIAEDVAINREIIISLLESTRASVVTVDNGRAAIDTFEANPDDYDLILMDMQMPELDGIEATKRIRAMDIERAREIPIVAMTANVFREDIERCLASGMNGHIGKPLDMDEVIKTLRKHLMR